MNDLLTVVKSLDQDESLEFQKFVQRSRFKSGRKDLMLFNILRALDADEKWNVLERLELKNLNAYHTLRKRLYAELGLFFLEHEKSEDDKYERVLSHLRLAKHLFARSQGGLARKFLVKAFKIAECHQFYKLLDQLYLLSFEHYQEGEFVEFGELERLFSANKLMIELEERVLLSKIKMSMKVEQSKKEGVPFDFFPMVEEEISNSELREVFISNPKILLDFLTTIKKSAQVSKSYLGLEKILETYINNDKFLDFVTEKIQLDYLLAHTKYRNKKFEESYNLIQRSKLLLPNCSKVFRREYGFKLKELTCANLVFLGRIEDGIATLRTELDNEYLSLRQRANLIVTLGIYYFLIGDRNESMKLLLMLKHTESWYKKEMGVEWVFKKNLMEIILFIDLGKTEVALSKIRSIERRFKEFLMQESYERAKSYLLTVKGLMLDKLSQEEVRERIKSSWSWLPAEEEDLQAMLFYCWLKARFENKEYYEVVLDTVNI